MADSLARARLVFTFPLRAPTVTIGQAADNDLLLIERGVALQHARLLRVGDTYAVEDASRGETWVSARGIASELKPTARSVLQLNALVQFGGALFRFVQFPDGVFALQREFELHRLPARIGADADNDLVFNAPTISTHHAEISFDGANFVIRDLQSTNGTYVALDGDPAHEHAVVSNLLRDGSRVRLGSVVFTFRTS